MRKTIILALMTLLLGACDNKVKFTIEGNIEGAKDSVLYFEHVSLSGLKPLDSLKLGADGAFRFQADTTAAPEFYVLRIHDQIINISIDSTETVTVKAQYPNMAARYEVEGSDNCEKIRSLALMQQDLLRKAIALEQNQTIPPGDAQDSLRQMVDRYKQTVLNNYIFKEPNKTYSYFALFQTLGRWLIFNPKESREDLRVFAAVATSWDTFYPGADRTENLHNIVIESMQQLNGISASTAQQGDGPTIVESGIIELQLPDKNGNLLTLSSLKGKVVLLDFHTFTLPESAQRILMLRELYNKYHEQGLEIYQVSLDQDEHFWKQMTQHLPWVCVRDDSLQSAMSYNVTDVPEFFLINRNSQLQKRSSQMTDLEAEIKSLL